MGNVTKSWSNSWLENCQIASEERLIQVPHINYVLRLSFKRSKILVNRNYWISNNQNKIKTKTYGFCMQRIILASLKSKRILKTICDDVITILFGNTMKHIFSCALKYSSGLFTASKLAFSLLKKWSF